MPWKAFKDVAMCSQSHPWAVRKLSGPGGTPVGPALGCHASEADANKQVAALNVNVAQ